MTGKIGFARGNDIVIAAIGNAGGEYDVAKSGEAHGSVSGAGGGREGEDFDDETSGGS